MTKFYRLIGIFLLVTMVIVGSVFLPGCTPEEVIENVSLAAAIAKAEQTQDKKINSKISLSIIMYDPMDNGEPKTVAQRIEMERVRKEGNIYIKGTIGTSKFSLPVLMDVAIRVGLTQAPEDLGKYINGEVKGVFEIGYSDGTVNGRADVCADGVNPDYRYTLDEKEYSLFIGAGFADILAEQQNTDFNYIKEIDILDTVMKPIVPTVDFSVLTNSLGDEINIGTGEFNFQYTIPGGSLLDMILAEVNEVYGEYILNLDDAEMLAFVQNVYSSYYEMAKGWITIGDTVYTGSANAEGYLLSSGYESRITIRVPDDDIKLIATELELADENRVDDLLNALHRFVSSPGGVKNVTEISFVLNIQETFDYNPVIDLSSDIFTPASENLEGRTVFRREREAEEDDFNWNPYGGDFD
ncbi:MAG: hypothetical protein GXY10_07410 [Clostridiales bacterium]|nr:hypothetical protein [Clostridiales bacterium]